MAVKHTPGPWTPEPGGVHVHERLLASVWLPRPMPDEIDERQDGESWLDARQRLEPVRIAIEKEREANARLIAAAPELLEALRECVNLMTALQVSPHHHRDVVALAHAAIAKAAGES